MHLLHRLHILAASLIALGFLVIFVSVSLAQSRSAIHYSPGEQALFENAAAKYGVSAWCMEEVAERESGWRENPNAEHVYNTYDHDAYGIPQFRQHYAEWDNTPLGRSGLPVTSTTAAQQIDMMAWSFSVGHQYQAWGVSLPSGC